MRGKVKESGYCMENHEKNVIFSMGTYMYMYKDTEQNFFGKVNLTSAPYTCTCTSGIDIELLTSGLLGEGEILIAVC